MSSLPSEPTVAQSGSSAIEREGTTDSSTQPPRPRDPGQPIDLLGFLKGLGHHWLAGLITFIVAAGLLVGYSLLMAPKNTVGTVAAHAHVMVTLPEPRTEAQATVESATVGQIMSNYVALTTPDPIVNAAVKYLHDGTTADDLKAGTSVYWGGGGTVIAVYAMGTNQNQAIERANAYARAFAEKANDLVPSSLASLPQPKLTIVQPAFPSDPNPNAPATNKNSTKLSSPMVGVAAGLILGLVVMGVLEYRSSRRSRTSR